MLLQDSPMLSRPHSSNFQVKVFEFEQKPKIIQFETKYSFLVSWQFLLSIPPI